VLWAPLVLFATPWWVRLIVVAVVFVVGVVAERGEDPQVVVIDEVAGMGVTLLFASSSWLALLLGFVCFRIFDIAKPWPVSWADSQVGGGLGVMLDDIVAGLYALCVLALLERVVVPGCLPFLVVGATS
jgi:phosphatidylglycerophosphatase A